MLPDDAITVLRDAAKEMRRNPRSPSWVHSLAHLLEAEAAAILVIWKSDPSYRIPDNDAAVEVALRYIADDKDA